MKRSELAFFIERQIKAQLTLCRPNHTKKGKVNGQSLTNFVFNLLGLKKPSKKKQAFIMEHILINIEKYK